MRPRPTGTRARRARGFGATAPARRASRLWPRSRVCRARRREIFERRAFLSHLASMRASRSRNLRAALRNAVSASTPRCRPSATAANSRSPTSSSRSSGSAPRLRRLLADLCGRASGVFPVEPDLAGALLELVRVGERRKRFRHALEHRRAAFLVILDRLPVRDDLGRAFNLDVAEHVRVTVHELGDEAARDVVDVERARVRGHLRMEHDLQEQIRRAPRRCGRVRRPRWPRAARTSRRAGTSRATRASARRPMGIHRVRAGAP